MREIKFRAWDKTNKRFAYFEHKDNQIVFKALPIQVGTVLNPEIDPDCQQYTGCKDKNQVEIYEGDLAKHENGRIYEVRWTHGCFGWFNPENEMDNLCFHQSRVEEFEVIGNIYENPELLATT